MIAAADFDFLKGLLRERAAIVLEAGHEYVAESRLGPLAKAEGIPSLDELMRRMRSDPRATLVDRVIDALTTNETIFFRDIHPFEVLTNELLPELVKNAGERRRLTVWSAACSSGQEPYSVAMCLRETNRIPPTHTVDIIASDLSDRMLERARAGRYSELEINRGIPAQKLVRHFTQSGEHWLISDAIRKMVQFKRMNLAAPWPSLPPIDLLLLRNVLIYFDQPTKRAILSRARQVMAPGGFLLLGGSETTIGVDEVFERTMIGRTAVYRMPRRGGR